MHAAVAFAGSKQLSSLSIFCPREVSVPANKQSNGNVILVKLTLNAIIVFSTFVVWVPGLIRSPTPILETIVAFIILIVLLSLSVLIVPTLLELVFPENVEFAILASMPPSPVSKRMQDAPVEKLFVHVLFKKLKTNSESP
ncbi:MAG: hypothetical protein E2O29_04575 [Deltaproteobacteria bacterium]|nr:MAG: hypothetical protein E2O29_04575 [Deltaproteobacteria bacterium]